MPRDSTTGRGGKRCRPECLGAALRRLEALDAAELGSEWAARHGSDVPPALPARLVRLALAHALQAEAFGGLSRGAARRLDRLVGAAGESRAPRAPRARRVVAKPGATLVRDWGGRTYRVEVLAEGHFAFNGRRWRSLSAIAREITGTRRNGPAFFGLRESGDGTA